MTLTTKLMMPAAGAALLAACTFQFQIVQSWVHVPQPTGSTDVADLEVHHLGAWGVERLHGTPYTYLRCFRSDGQELGLAKMKDPYFYQEVEFGDDGELFAIVAYRPNGETTHAWIQQLDANCGHVGWTTIDGQGTGLGHFNGLQYRSSDGAFFLTSSLFDGQNRGLIRRYDSISGTWSPAFDLYDSVFPNSGLSGPDLRYDAGDDVLVYGEKQQVIVDPATLLATGYRTLDIPTAQPLRTWSVYAGHTVAGLWMPNQLAVFAPDGTLEHTNTWTVSNVSALDLGLPLPGATNAPVWAKGLAAASPPGTVHKLKLDVLP